MMYRKMFKEKGCYLILGILTLFCCCLVCGRSSVFASKVDWISQHSVFPDYFRQQFYDTGQFFPEFAANIGGGQNIYNFAYYGLYSPVILFSYILPFVKMGDYLMWASIFSLLAAVLFFYYWLLRKGISKDVCFLTSVIFLLASPMIYHSYNQIMFVNYMPYLCLALIAVDRYFEQRKIALYTISVFLMIMTSFYFSIGGMFVLVLYGIFRYLQVQEEQKKQIQFLRFFADGFRFLLPMISAVLMSAVLLVPTAMSLMGGRAAKTAVNLGELLIPKVQVFLYSPYGIGLTTLIITVLMTGLSYKKYYEKLLHFSCILIITVPIFSYLLNGGLYVRNKAMIPFLPLLCYLIAEYMERQKQRKISFPAGCVPFVLTLLCVYWGHRQGEFSRYWQLVLLDGILMLLGFLAYYAKKYYQILLIIPIFSLCLAGMFTSQISDKRMDRKFYAKVSDQKIKKTIREIAEEETGFYRMEQSGRGNENAANINRIWDMDQYISSIYSSSYHADYQDFQRETFMLDQPFRNVLMQPAAKNPIYQQLMGVKYILSDHDIRGYQKYKTKKGLEVYQREDVLPVAYVSDRMVSEKAYKNLDFPYNQALLSEYAIAEEGEEQWERIENPNWQIRAVTAEIPECSEEDCTVEKTEEGYHIQAGCRKNLSLQLQDLGDADTFFVQFRIQNHRKTKDVSVWLDDIENKLTASTHIYYNNNETFSYAVKLADGETDLELGFGAGDYDLSDIQFFAGNLNGGVEKLCQSAFQIDRNRTKGNRIAGSVTAKNNGYFITSIPFDENFSLQLDGKEVEYEKVNVAFLGMRIEEGEHQIEIVYHAPGLQIGKYLSMIGWVLLLVQCGFHYMAIHRKSVAKK